MYAAQIEKKTNNKLNIYRNCVIFFFGGGVNDLKNLSSTQGPSNVTDCDVQCTFCILLILSVLDLI